METIRPFNQPLTSHLTQFMHSFLENNLKTTFSFLLFQAQDGNQTGFCPTRKKREKTFIQKMKHSKKKTASPSNYVNYNINSLRYGNVESRVLLFKPKLTEIWSSFNCLSWSENHILLFCVFRIYVQFYHIRQLGHAVHSNASPMFGVKVARKWQQLKPSEPFNIPFPSSSASLFRSFT